MVTRRARRDRDGFVAFIAQRTPGLSPYAAAEIAREMMRHASAEQRWAEIQYSVNIDDAEREQQERASEKRHQKMQLLLDRLGEGFRTLETRNDPRGAVYVVCGVAVPCDGYTGEQLDRLSRYWEQRRERESKAKAGKVTP